MELVKERTDQLQHQALHDSLTGLPNRALILDRIDRMLARSRRENIGRRRALPRPRQLQGHQRHPGSPRGRRTARKRRGATAERGTRERHGRTTRRRRIRRSGRRCLTWRPVSMSSPNVYSTSWPRRSSSRPARSRCRSRPVSVSPKVIARRPKPSCKTPISRSTKPRRPANNGPSSSSRRCRTSVDHHRRLEVDLQGALGGQFFLMYQPTVDLATGRLHRRRGAPAMEAPRARHRPTQ